MNDDGIDTILAYGFRGVTVDLLNNMLEIALNENTEQEYVEMCNKVMHLIRTCCMEK